MRLAGNEYNRSEFAGAFGDLGTLIPFVVGYITIARLDAQGVLLGFGALAITSGLYFRTQAARRGTYASAHTRAVRLSSSAFCCSLLRFSSPTPSALFYGCFPCPCSA